jgi:multidrug efflux system membrane fusion protein
LIDTPDWPAVMPVLAATAYSGDIAVRLDSLGTVDLSNTVVFSIAQDYVQGVVKRFDAGQTLTVEAADRHGKPFGHGVLRGVDNQIDTSTGMLRCVATLVPDADRVMLRGMSLNIRLTLDVKHKVTLVPFAAIQRDSETAYVWAIKPDRTVSRRYVQVGTVERGVVEIRSGLSPGELVVNGQALNMREGQKIRHTLEENSGAIKTK